MAIRYRKGRASPWQCYWNNPLTGKRECANFATRHEAEKHDSLIKHRLRFDRESFQRETEEENEKDERGLTLEAAYLLYLRHKQFTRKGLSWQMDAMMDPLRMIGNMSVSEIRREHFVAVMERQAQKNVKPSTVRGRMSVLRTVLRWCAAQGFMVLPELPKLPAAHYEKFIPPTPEELGRIMAAAAPHIQRVIVLGAQCGVRVGPSELLGLTWEDVDLDRQILRIHGAKKNLHAPWREVPIRDSLVPLFARWEEEDAGTGIEYVIHYRGKPVSKINKAWGKTLERAGITRRIRPYDLRHAFATEMIAGDVDIGTVAKLMGHSNPTMILNHYQYVMDGQKRAAVEKLPDIQYVSKAMCPKRKGTHRIP